MLHMPIRLLEMVLLVTESSDPPPWKIPVSLPAISVSLIVTLVGVSADSMKCRPRYRALCDSHHTSLDP